MKSAVKNDPSIRDMGCPFEGRKARILKTNLIDNYILVTLFEGCGKFYTNKQRVKEHLVTHFRKEFHEEFKLVDVYKVEARTQYQNIILLICVILFQNPTCTLCNNKYKREQVIDNFISEWITWLF